MTDEAKGLAAQLRVKADAVERWPDVYGVVNVSREMADMAEAWEARLRAVVEELRASMEHSSVVASCSDKPDQYAYSTGRRNAYQDAADMLENALEQTP